MPRRIRVQSAGAIYHVMNRGNRQDFLKTLARACQKTGFHVHAYCLMSNHFHLVVETPNANLVEGMRWLLSAYTIRLNHRHKRLGHVFSGRYQASFLPGGKRKRKGILPMLWSSLPAEFDPERRG